MTIPMTLKSYLARQSADYEMLTHRYAEGSLHTAAVAHVPGHQLAKAVIVKEADGYLMVVLPSDHHVHLGRLHQHLGHDVGLASENELRSMFPDCSTGAVPPLGLAYGIKTLVDRCLTEGTDIYFEAGDHRHLIRMDAAQFARLLGGAERVDVGVHI